MISSEDIYGSISLNTNPFGKRDIYTYIGRVKLQNHYTKIIYFRGGRFEVKSCGVLYTLMTKVILGFYSFLDMGNQRVFKNFHLYSTS